MVTKVVEQSFQRAGCYIVSESNIGSDNVPMSRKRKSLQTGQGVLVAGTVLGELSADNTYVVYDPSASDGREVAVAVLFSTVDTTTVAGSTIKAPIDRGQMAVHGEYLVLDTTVDATGISDAITSLEGEGFVIRNMSDFGTTTVAIL